LKILFRLLFILFFSSIRNNSSAQYRLGANSYGMIVNNDTSALFGVIGSGFAIDSNIVISSYHLFKNFRQTKKFYRVPYNQTTPIRLIDSLPAYDIAIFRSGYYLTNMPMVLGDFKSVRKGDRIGYVGYDKKGAIIYCVGYISKIDSVKSKGKWINRITFSAKDLHCHPGSPIINTKGKIIAMVISSSINKKADQHVGIVAYSIMQLKQKRFL